MLAAGFVAADVDPRRVEAHRVGARNVGSQGVADVDRSLRTRLESAQRPLERRGVGFRVDAGVRIGVDPNVERVLDPERPQFLDLGLPAAVRNESHPPAVAGVLEGGLGAGTKPDGGGILDLEVSFGQRGREGGVGTGPVGDFGEQLGVELLGGLDSRQRGNGRTEVSGRTEGVAVDTLEGPLEHRGGILRGLAERAVEIETDLVVGSHLVSGTVPNVLNVSSRDRWKPGTSPRVPADLSIPTTAVGFATFKPLPFETRAMTRAVWVKADDAVGDWDARRARITTALEAGADWVLVDEDDVERVRELGEINVAAFRTDGDVTLVDDVDVVDEAETESESGPTAEPDAVVVGKNGEGDGTIDPPTDLSGSADLSTLRREGELDRAAYVRILGKEYEAFAESAAEEADHTIVVGEDWTIIPLENLIARIGDETELVAGVTSADEARTAFETLELGADAVLLDSDDPDEIRRTVEVRDEAERESLELEYAEVLDVEQIGSADRVCVDTGSLLEHDEGMLVGSMARGLVFVHAETAESPYVASRPFRVNAGAVHAYVRTPDGGTKYLSELQSGDEVQIVDTDGNTREAIVGRVKIEQRPMFRVALETDDGDRVETLLQNAETIKVPTSAGRKAVTDLEAGDELLLYYEDTARHFGEAVEESIIEQ